MLLSLAVSVSLSFPSDKVFAIVFVLCCMDCAARTKHGVLFFLYCHSIFVNVFRIALTNAVHLLFGSFRMCLYLDFTQSIHNTLVPSFSVAFFHLSHLQCVQYSYSPCPGATEGICTLLATWCGMGTYFAIPFSSQAMVRGTKSQKPDSVHKCSSARLVEFSFRSKRNRCVPNHRFNFLSLYLLVRYFGNYFFGIVLVDLLSIPLLVKLKEKVFLQHSY